LLHYIRRNNFAISLALPFGLYCTRTPHDRMNDNGLGPTIKSIQGKQNRIPEKWTDNIKDVKDLGLRQAIDAKKSESRGNIM